MKNDGYLNLEEARYFESKMKIIIKILRYIFPLTAFGGAFLTFGTSGYILYQLIKNSFSLTEIILWLFLAFFAYPILGIINIGIGIYYWPLENEESA